MSTRLIDLSYTRENVSGSTDHLKGHHLSKVTATIQMGVSAYLKLNDDNRVLCGDPSYVTSDVITAFDSFAFEDFRKGDTISLNVTYKVATVVTAYPDNGTYEVAEVLSPTAIRLQQVGGGSVSLTEQQCDGGIIEVTSEPKGIRYSFGLIENNEPTNFKSKIDGQELNYVLNDATAIPAVLTDMETQGKLNGYTGTAQVRRLGYADSEWTYEIVHVFYINPLYLLNQLSLIQEGKAPSYYRLENSLKHAFRVRTYREDASSPFFQELTVDDRDGNVGFINENFNGKQPLFNIGTMTYGNTIGQAVKDAATTFDITINEDGAVAKYLEVFFYVLPELDTDYADVNTANLDLYAFDRVNVEVGQPAVNGYRFGTGFQAFTGVSASTAASVVTISGTLDFGADTQALIDARSDKRYLVYVSATSDAQTANDADTVLMQADFNQIGFEIPTATATHEVLFITHDQNQLAEGIGYTTREMVIHEEMVMNNTISLDTSQIDGAKLDSVRGSIIAKKNTGEVVELEAKEFSLIGAQEIDGVRFVDLEAPTGFNAISEEVRSKYRLFRDTGADADPVFKYRFAYPFMFRWEYYKQLVLQELEPDLFDASEQFNGYNHNWQRIGELAGWDIYFRLESVVSVSGKTLTTTTDKEIVHHDYLANSEWFDEEITTYDEDGNALEVSGTPFLNDVGKTEIRASFFNNALDVVSAYYMIIVLGRFEQDGFKQVMTLSSVWDRSGISTLENEDNSGKVALEIIGNELRGTAFIDADNLEGDVSKYSIFAWVKGKSLPVPGCTITATPSGSDNDYSLMAINMTGTDDTGGGSGTATANVIRGASPYSYLWDDPNTQTTQTATGLSAGIYNCLVTDDNGCTIQDFYEVLAGSFPDGTFLDKYTLTGITDLVSEDMGGGVTRHYLTSFSLGKFAVVDFDGTNFTEVYLSPVLSAKPFQLHIDSTHIYYGSNTDNDVCKIPKSDFTSVTSVDLGVSTWEIAEIDTDYIVVANGLSQSFKVLDKATLTTQQTVSTPSINRTRRPLVKGNYLFVIDETSERIEVYEWNDVTKQFNTTAVEVVTNRGQQQMYLDGNNLFVGANTDEAFILDVTDPTAITDIASFTGLPTTNTFRPYISSGGNFLVPDKINPDGVIAYNSAQVQQYDIIDGTNFDDPFVIRDNNNVIFAANGNGDLTAHYKANP